ncbi:Calx-beta domain-containing protein [Shewanella sp. 125m-1]
MNKIIIKKAFKPSLLTLALVLSLSANAGLVEHGDSCKIAVDDVRSVKPSLMFKSVPKVGGQFEHCSNDWTCYVGAGTSDDPYLVTFGMFVSPESLSEFGAREIEALVQKGVDEFNQSVANFPELGLPHVKGVMSGFVNVPESVFKFGVGTMDDDYYDFWNDAYSYIASQRFDVVTQFHSYPDDSGTYGVAGGHISINLAGHHPFLSGTFVHEAGHVFGAGHHKGASTSGAMFPYSNAVVCELEDGTRVSSVVSAWEHSSRLLRFSDPSMACGVHGETENARTVAERLPEIAKMNELRQVAGSVSFSVDTQSVNEGQPVTVTVVRDGDTTKNAFVGLWSEGLTPLQMSGSLYHYVEFPAGGNSVDLVLATQADGIYIDGSSLLSLSLDYPIALSIADSSAQEIEVINVDEPQAGEVSFKLDKMSVSEGNSVDIELVRTDGSDGELSINLATVLGTATAANVNLINESVTFVDGEASKTISLKTIRDNVYSDAKTLTLNLSGAVAGNTSLAISITNLDAKPPVESGGSSGGSMGFSVLLLGLVAAVRRMTRK